jgi:hypothetical protein
MLRLQRISSDSHCNRAQPTHTPMYRFTLVWLILEGEIASTYHSFRIRTLSLVQPVVAFSARAMALS